MEEQQIQDFVHRIYADEVLREELEKEPEHVIEREGFSPVVARIVLRLVPQLRLDSPPRPALGWWH